MKLFFINKINVKMYVSKINEWTEKKTLKKILVAKLIIIILFFDRF